MNLTLEDALRAQIARMSESAMRERERYEAQIAAMTRTMMDWDQLRANPVITINTNTINTNTIDADVLRTRLAAIEDGRSIARAVIFDSAQSHREPTREEMENALRAAVDAGADTDETTFDGWTIRRCRHCKHPVAGGPTACEPCVARRDGDSRADLAEQVLRDAVESGRVTVQVVFDRYDHHLGPDTYARLHGPLPAAMTITVDDEPTAIDVEMVGVLATLARCVEMWDARSGPRADLRANVRNALGVYLRLREARRKLETAQEAT